METEQAEMETGTGAKEVGEKSGAETAPENETKKSFSEEVLQAAAEVPAKKEKELQEQEKEPKNEEAGTKGNGERKRFFYERRKFDSLQKKISEMETLNKDLVEKLSLLNSRLSSDDEDGDNASPASTEENPAMKEILSRVEGIESEFIKKKSEQVIREAEKTIQSFLSSHPYLESYFQEGEEGKISPQLEAVHEALNRMGPDGFSARRLEGALRDVFWDDVLKETETRSARNASVRKNAARKGVGAPARAGHGASQSNPTTSASSGKKKSFYEEVMERVALQTG